MLIQSMTRKIETWPDLIGLWDTLAHFADAIGVPHARVRGWVYRKSVRRRYFPAICEAAKAVYIADATPDDLAALAWSKPEN